MSIFTAESVAGAVGEVADPVVRVRAFCVFCLSLHLSLKHFLTDRRRNEGREKRGGDAGLEALDAPASEDSPGIQIADPSAAFPDKLFDREWAHAIMDRSLAAVPSAEDIAGELRHLVGVLS